MYPKKLGRVYYVYHYYDAKKGLATPVLEVRHITKIWDGGFRFEALNKKTHKTVEMNGFVEGVFIDKKEAIKFYNKTIDESIESYQRRTKQLEDRALKFRQHIATLKYY